MLFVFQQNPIEMSWAQVSQAYIRFFVRVINFLPEIVGALFVIGFTGLTARFVRRAVNTAMGRTKADPNVRFLVVRIAGVMVWLVGMAVMLSVLNVNTAGIFAGIGVTGAAIGFAVRDIIANFVAGIVLLSIRPFKLGDKITIESHEGIVERIEIRATVLRSDDGKEVSIPNATVFSSVIVNHSTHNLRRISFSIGIDYEAELGGLQEILSQAIQTVANVAASPSPEVIITGFSANVVNIEIHCWVEPGANLTAVASRVRLKIKEALQHAQIAVAPAASMMLLRPGRGVAGT